MLSTAYYKRYNHPLLIQLENKWIGCTRIHHVTVADNLNEMTHSHAKMQVMLPTSGGFANGARFVIHPTKSCILKYWDKYLQHQQDGYTMNCVEVGQVQHSTNLWIHRDSSNTADITEKVNLGRRTAYSLLGAGLHFSRHQKRRIVAKISTSIRRFAV